MIEVKHRLMRYVALAAAVPAASAAGELVTSPAGPVGVATPGTPLTVDFGPSFGSIFRFEANTASFSFAFTSALFVTTQGYSFIQTGTAVGYFWNGVFQFDPANGFASGAQLINLGTGNDPMRLGSGFLISGGMPFLAMSSYLGGAYPATQHDLDWARLTYFYFADGLNGGSGYFFQYAGDWLFGGQRGYLGFSFTQPDGVHYGWFDVEVPASADEIRIHGWAFETKAGVPVITPTPAAGGLLALALGAGGIRRARRDGELAAV